MFEEILNKLKREGINSIKYIKITYNKTNNTYYIKIVLKKPIESKILINLIQELERGGFKTQIYAPHALAVRIDVKK